MSSIQLNRIRDYLWEIPKSAQEGMNVPGRIYASEKLLRTTSEDKSPQQVANVACLPGIVGYSLAMPDIHWGYGFPIGGVAAFDIDQGGVISPGGVGYDINCGVRLIRTNLFEKDIRPYLRDIVTQLYNAIPSGVGSSGAIPKLSHDEEIKLLTLGARWAIKKGYGSEADLENIEDNGVMEGADPSLLSETAIKRGLPQVGTLGSGNHFLEIDKVVEIYRPEVARVFGLEKDGIVIQVHSGSRGLGYQVCDDYVRKLLRASQKYGINLPDRQLAAAPVNSEEGRQYLSAMACAANYAWVNRQVIMHLANEAFIKSLKITPRNIGLKLIYDICHNIAKIEEHEVNGQKKKLCVHRKGATRAFPPHHPLVPKEYNNIGQPVLLPGDMGRSSFLCVGTDEAMKTTFGSTCHGAGRVASRSQMIKSARGQNLYKEMEAMGVIVMTKTHSSMAEEMPAAYKDVSDVVEVMEIAGISKKVAKFKPLGVIKG